MDNDDRPDQTGQLLQEFVQQMSSEVVTPLFAAPAPGKRHRPHRRDRRRLTLALSLVVVVAAVAVLVIDGPRSGETGTGVSRSTGTAGEPTGVRVRSVTFGGAFHPDQVVGTDGTLWLIGQNGAVSDSGRCHVARIDPVTVATVTYPLSACGMNVVAGGGALYLETEKSRPDNSYLIHIERFSLATKTSTVLPAVAMTVFGSEIAHTQLAYVGGRLWLYGTTTGSRVVQVSPTTGAMVRTYSDVPDIGGTEPLISSGPGGEVWLAGGPGGSPTPAVISRSPTVVAPVPVKGLSPGEGGSTIEWMAPVGGNVWVGVAAATDTLGQTSAPLIEHILKVDRAGAVIGRSRAEDFGSAPLSVAGTLFSVGPGQSCADQPVWHVDVSTLRTTLATTLHPADACGSEGSFRYVAAAGGSLFVLDTTGSGTGAELYRIKPCRLPSIGCRARPQART
jgi:hypothetical protein